MKAGLATMPKLELMKLASKHIMSYFPACSQIVNDKRALYAEW